MQQTFILHVKFYNYTDISVVDKFLKDDLGEPSEKRYAYSFTGSKPEVNSLAIVEVPAGIRVVQIVQVEEASSISPSLKEVIGVVNFSSSSLELLKQKTAKYLTQQIKDKLARKAEYLTLVDAVKTLGSEDPELLEMLEELKLLAE